MLQVHKKAVEKMLRNDAQILSKLELLITSQKNIENRIINIEKRLNDNNKKNEIDADDLKVI